MQFEIKERTKISLKIYGQEFNLSRPNVAQAEAFIEKLEAAKDSTVEGIRLQKSFVCSLGLPMEFIDSMESEHFGELASYLLTPSKKN